MKNQEFIAQARKEASQIALQKAYAEFAKLAEQCVTPSQFVAFIETESEVILPASMEGEHQYFEKVELKINNLAIRHIGYNPACPQMMADRDVGEYASKYSKFDLENLDLRTDVVSPQHNTFVLRNSQILILRLRSITRRMKLRNQLTDQSYL